MLSILLIDDNPNDRLMIDRELKKAFAELEIRSVIDAKSLDKALEIGGFDLIITDYQLHWNDGLTVLKKIKACHPNCPVIMCTDSGSEEVAVAGMKAGLSDYVFKGRHFQRLVGAVRESLEKYQLRQQYEATAGQLAISEERLRLAIGASKMGIRDWNILTSEVVLSAEHERLFGLATGSFKGTWEALLACIHPDDRDRVARAVAQTLENKTDYQNEYRVIWPDGSERWLASRGKFFYDRSGKAARSMAVVWDITDRKQLEFDRAQAVMRQRSYLHRLQKLTAASVEINSTLSVEEILQLAVDRARSILETHQAAVNLNPTGNWERATTKISLSEKYARWQDYNEAPDGTGIYNKVCQTQQVMRMTQAELESHQAWRGFGKAAGKHPPMRGWLAAPLTARDGKNLGVIQLSDKYEGEFGEDDESLLVQLAQAVSGAIDNAKLYEASQQANRMKDEFLATLSHELRSPLNAILGWTQLLRNRTFSPVATMRALETIERNARLQTQLIEDLLDISRIIRGKLTLNPSSVNLVSIVEAAVNTVKLAADAKAIEVQFAIADLAPQNVEVCEKKAIFDSSNVAQNPRFLVSGDPGRLQQVVWNLLSNAIKFTPRDGRVEIQLQRLEAQVELAVSDTGMGIAADFLPYVFESFRQADASITRNHSGLGLGLAIVRQLVELHGGTVSADSPGLERGATFTFRLPAIQVDAGAGEASEGLDVGADLRGIKVLVVDDEVDSREFLVFVLEEYGAKVRAAASAAEAVEAAIEFVPDVLVSDIGMPEEDGYSLMARLRAKQGKFRAIALTAYARDEDRDRALAVGFDRHLAKPVTPDGLVEAVAQLNLLGRRS
ncbi:MAG: response regulator [Oscillatoriaceae cyanobacterium Prado104]|jgi:PAS domain S-box-containing protein|nr:response regulator [Oscillatoriaceae cyanobacterium Prado104]